MPKGGINLSDRIQGEKSCGFAEAIRTTSRAGDLLTFEQIARYPNITFYNYGPGLVRSGQIVKNAVMRLFLNTVGRLFSRSAEQAANDIAALLTGPYASGFYGSSAKPWSPSYGRERGVWWRRWESNPAVSDTLTPSGHSVFPRIAIKGLQPDLLLTYPGILPLALRSGHYVVTQSSSGARPTGDSARTSEWRRALNAMLECSS